LNCDFSRENRIKVILDNPQKLRKLRVEAIILVGGMNKNYIGYSLQVEEVGGFSRAE
jgi:hypothetical protein